MNVPVREYAGGSVGGILRKGPNSAASSTASSTGGGDARQVDLLVFGYACKVFRDDAKARDIDQGKHLIPWMGENSLKIDRYDVRGALFDLSPHEPPPGGYGNRLDYLSADEQRAEQLCEEERYLYLYNNEEELTLQQEEELKRLQQEGNSSGYNQVAFQYGNEDGASDTGGIQHGPNREDFNAESPTGADEPDQVYIVPRNFDVPAFIQLPDTMKQHAIIEKTARFIATQGVQMEILLKAKQSNNVQFEFLSQNSLLNPYYKYVVNAIKEGKYPSEQPAKNVALDAAESAAIADVAAASAQRLAKPVIAVPTIKYKPSADCAYTQLISKIKGVPLPEVLDESEKAAAATATYTNEASAAIATTSGSDGGDFTPVLLQYNGNTFVTADADADGDESNSNSNSNVKSTTTSVANSNSNSQDSSPKVEILKNTSALALAQGYSSGSDDDDEENDEQTVATKVSEKLQPEPELSCPIPPENLKNIIDKTATYVIKNGRQFEETLRTKGEERFTFLLAENEYYPYYMYKITGDPEAASKEQKTRKAAAVAAALISRKGLITDKTVSPVSFTLKPRDEPTAAVFPPALPQEPSDEEDIADSNVGAAGSKCLTVAGDMAQHSRLVPEHVQKAIKLVESQLMARNAQIAAAVCVPLLSSCCVTPVSLPAPVSVRSRFDIDFGASNLKTHVKSSKAELERNALFEQQQQIRQKKLKKAEEKVKDKLAQIAREKLGGLITKEKQLQQERKRKAMAFLNQIKGTPPAGADAEPCSDNPTKVEDDDENGSDESATSVHSIPITSFGPDEHSDDEEELDAEQGLLLRLPLATTTATTTTSLPHKPQELAMTKSSTATVSLCDDDDGIGGGGGGCGGGRDREDGAVVDTDDEDDDVQLVSETKPPTARRRPNLAAIKSRRSRSRDYDAPTVTSHRRHQRRERVNSTSSTASSYSSAVTASSLDASDRAYSSRSRHAVHKAHKSRKSSKRERRSSRDRNNSKRLDEHSRSRSHRRSTSRHRSHRRHARHSRSCSPASSESTAAHEQFYEQCSSRTSSKRKATKRKYDR